MVPVGPGKHLHLPSHAVGSHSRTKQCAELVELVPFTCDRVHAPSGSGESEWQSISMATVTVGAVACDFASVTNLQDPL